MFTPQLFETLTRVVPGLVWISDDHGQISFNNPQWTAFTGMTQHDGLGLGWLDAVHPADAAAFRAQTPFDPKRSATIQAQLRLRRHDGAYHRHLLSVRHIGDNGWVGCAIDAEEWLSAELRDATHGDILELVSGGADLEAVLAELCRAGERQIPGSTCSILLVDAARGRFVSGVAPGIAAGLLEAVGEVPIGTGVGACGTAAFERRDVVSVDIATDPLWETWRDAILPLGFRSCWSKPVFDSKGDVIATFGFYFKTRREPSAQHFGDMIRLRRLAALAIERALMLDALKESEEHYRHTVEQSPLIPWTADAHGNILSVSSRWTDMTGIARADALGRGWMLALHPDDVDPTIEYWTKALETGAPVNIHYRLRGPRGRFRWSRARATARRDTAGRIVCWYGTVEDVHEHYLATERLKRQAYHDDLTGLPNRRRFVEELRHRLAHATEPIGLMVLDMDDFKLVNDRYGHQTGDAVLRLFGRHLELLAAKEEFVARLGGDEFAIISAKVCDDYCLFERAIQLETMLDRRLKANKKSRNCKPSFGCAVGQPGENADELFKRADLALYDAKASGKGRVKLFNPSIRSAATKRSEALDLARVALRDNWIEAFYQPVVSLRSQVVTGFEALLRVRHPELGLLSPIAVKDALDDPRLADALAIRMAHLVTSEMARWQADGVPSGTVSVNLATDNLVNPEYVRALLHLLKCRSVPLDRMKLEITERVFLDETGDQISTTLGDLREAGIRISLDDFGTGYASLVHLKTLPVDEIKIDRSFVSGLGTPQNRGEIVRAMIGLAKDMNLHTVAEGIETQGEALMLTAWGCESGQGYLFAKPMSAAEVPGFLARRARDIALG
jgi:diguanylate cyclase (GGDEF)-like protein/PAS domain S-box-containing protein